MNNLETRQYEMLIRVRDFGAAHSELFPSTSFAGDLFATIAAVLIELDGHTRTQTSSAGASREGTTSKGIARATLLDDLEAINRTARAMSLTTPGLDDKFRLPRSPGARALLIAARSFAHDAAPLKAEFVRREMSENFLEDLDGKIKEFEDAISVGHHSAGTKLSAGVAIDDAMDRGLKAMQELNAIVQNKLRNDGAALAFWTSARHVERNTGTTRPAKADAPKPDAQPPASGGSEMAKQ